MNTQDKVLYSLILIVELATAIAFGIWKENIWALNKEKILEQDKTYAY